LANGYDYIPGFGHAAPWRIVLTALGIAGVPALLLLLTIKEPALNIAATASRASGYGAAFGYLGRYWSVFLPLMLFNPLVGMVTLSYGAWIAPILIRNWHLTPPEVGATLGPMMLLLPLPGLFLTGRVLDALVKSRGVRGPALFAIPLVIAFGIIHFTCPLMTTPMLFWGFLAALIAISGVCFPITNILIALTVPQHLVGKVSAIQYVLYGIVGATIGPSAVAIASDNYFGGAIATALGVVSGVCAAMALICIVITERGLKRNQGDLERNARMSDENAGALP
jgi:MFS family permease